MTPEEGYEIHLTRGDGFGAAQPAITADEWQAALLSVAPEAGDPTQSTFHGSTFAYRDGLVSCTSPSDRAFELLKSLKDALDARLFGQDGAELALPEAQHILATIRTVIPDFEGVDLDEDAAKAIVDPTTEAAFDVLDRLNTDERVVALAYYVVCVFYGGGSAAPALTCAAATIFEAEAGFVQLVRVAPLDVWLNDVEKLANAMQKRPGRYTFRTCLSCGGRNRIPLFTRDAEGKTPKCGRCGGTFAEN